MALPKTVDMFDNFKSDDDVEALLLNTQLFPVTDVTNNVGRGNDIQTGIIAIAFFFKYSETQPSPEPISRIFDVMGRFLKKKSIFFLRAMLLNRGILNTPS